MSVAAPAECQWGPLTCRGELLLDASGEVVGVDFEDVLELLVGGSLGRMPGWRPIRLAARRHPKRQAMALWSRRMQGRISSGPQPPRFIPAPVVIGSAAQALLQAGATCAVIAVMHQGGSSPCRAWRRAEPGRSRTGARLVVASA
jgi:hypothetical protein